MVGEHEGLALAPLLHTGVAHKGTLELFWGTCPLIGASKVAARGLDIKDVLHVIPYDLLHGKSRGVGGGAAASDGRGVSNGESWADGSGGSLFASHPSSSRWCTVTKPGAASSVTYYCGADGGRAALCDISCESAASAWP
ncbi:hypothetical protein MRX96_019009 [Rhipicephalus microplus]